MLIVIPTPQEFEGLLTAWKSRLFKCTELVVGRLTVMRIAELNAVAACGGLGKTEFGVRTQHLLEHLDVSMLVCAGGAGSLSPELALGDVIVATQTVEHDFKARFGGSLLPSFAGSAKAIETLQAVPSPNAFRIHYGTVASGDEDIVSPHRSNEIRQLTGALAVAWEGAGGARACAFSGTPFVEIRGITDHADGKAATDYHLNLLQAMDNIAAVLSMWTNR